MDFEAESLPLLKAGVDLYTIFGSLASNAAPIRYNLRIVTDIAIVGPRTLATAGA